MALDLGDVQGMAMEFVFCLWHTIRRVNTYTVALSIGSYRCRLEYRELEI